MLSRSLPGKLSPSFFHGFLSVQHAVSLLPAKLSASYLHGFLSVQHAVSLPPSEAFPKLFPRFLSVQHAVSLPPSSPQAICMVSSLQACCLAPSQRSFPQAVSTVSSPSSMLSRSLPEKLSASYFHGFPSVQHAVSLPPSEALHKLFARFPLRPACCLAPSQRSSPQAISTVSCPSSMLSRSLPAKLSPSYFHGRLSVQHAVSLLPAKLSPSYLHGFLSVQHAVSLPPGEALRKLFPRFPLRPACCIAPSQRSSRKLNIFARFLVRPACCLGPSRRSLRKLFPRFPLRPPCCLAPSQRSFPQTISTVSHPSSLLSRFLPAKVSRFPFRPACGIAPSQRSSPQAICTVSYPSSMLSRFSQRSSPQAISTVSSPSNLLSPSYKAPRKLFPPFPVRPACCIAPVPAKLSASYLHGFRSVQHVLSRSLPAKLSARYLHGFLSVQHAVSLPPSEALRKLFPRFPLRPACCLAPSQ